ncbi:MAG: histone acetyltransferase [Chaenotheca gracillima]|nr:MAG: histone acetyltransferase [Chaenotheca gracillima]
MKNVTKRELDRKDERVILHFDYDCFYAAVFEVENPSLKSLPLAVQQKQIIVTCNYEARRRGLHKLQLVTSAKQACPDLIIVLGEDLTRFRDVSKALYNHLKEHVWSRRADRLGFDEVFLDVTDMVHFNIGLLNANDLENSFFHLSRTDPTVGFSYDASKFWGHTYPPSLGESVHPVSGQESSDLEGFDDPQLHLRLVVGSHLGQYLRHRLEEDKGFTSTVGISSSKLLSKLVGNLHKPKGQTTLVPPYVSPKEGIDSNVTKFIDSHGIGKIPGIGFKLAQKLRAHVLGRRPEFEEGLIYGASKEAVSVRDVRCQPDIGPELLEKLLGGPGSPHGIGMKVWGLLNGVDDSEVGLARKVPRQISLEDSYIRLDTLDQAKKELLMLSKSLIKRLHLDLLEDESEDDGDKGESGDSSGPSSEPAALQKHSERPKCKRWLAHPKTLRLSTRPRPPLNPDGTRTRSFNRISRSCPMPNFIFSLSENVDALAERLVKETLLPQFRKLHPERSGWNLSLVNVAATNMVETATVVDLGASAAGGVGGGPEKGADRDIGRMFKTQERFLKEWRVEDRDMPPESKVGGLSSETHDINSTSRPYEEERYRLTTSQSPMSGFVEQGEVVTEPTTPGHNDVPPEDEKDSTYYDDEADDVVWQEDDEDDDYNHQGVEDDFPSLSSGKGELCSICGVHMPAFAMPAHERYHAMTKSS